jgi:polyhydroxybutyrate depolymerase
MRFSKKFIIKFILVILCFFLFTSLAFLQDNSGRFRDRLKNRINENNRKIAISTDSSGEILVGNLKRTFLIHIPASYSKTQSSPVVLVFHGGTGTAAGMEKLTKMNEESEHEGFIVVYPEGIDRHWNDGRETVPKDVDDVGFVSALIDYLLKAYNVDSKRIYATGISNGGFFCQSLACNLANKIAAVASVAATKPEALNVKPSRAISVMVIAGTDDPLVPYNGGLVKGRGTSRGGYGGKVLSVSDTIKFWVANNNCLTSPKITQLPNLDNNDATTVEHSVYTSTSNNTEVILYKINGGGHTWPGGLQYLPKFLVGNTSRDINATQIIWQFFKTHQLK